MWISLGGSPMRTSSSRHASSSFIVSGAGRALFELGERAEQARRNADVGHLDAQVAVEVGAVAVKALPHLVGELADGEQVRVPKESDAVLEAETLAGADLSRDGVERASGCLLRSAARLASFTKTGMRPAMRTSTASSLLLQRAWDETQRLRPSPSSCCPRAIGRPALVAMGPRARSRRSRAPPARARCPRSSSRPARAPPRGPTIRAQATAAEHVATALPPGRVVRPDDDDVRPPRRAGRARRRARRSPTSSARTRSASAPSASRSAVRRAARAVERTREVSARGAPRGASASPARRWRRSTSALMTALPQRSREVVLEPEVIEQRARPPCRSTSSSVAGLAVERGHRRQDERRRRARASVRFSRWTTLSGVSRGTTTSVRRSLSMTSAARVRSVSEMPWAMRAAVPIEHGTTTIACHPALPLAKGAL